MFKINAVVIPFDSCQAIYMRNCLHGVTKKNQQTNKAWVQIALAELAKSVKFI